MDPEIVKALADAKAEFLKAHKEALAELATAKAEFEANGAVQRETASKIEAVFKTAEEFGKRLDKIEEKAARLGAGNSSLSQSDTLVKAIMESDSVKDLVSGKTTRARFATKAITNTYPLNNDQPLVPADRIVGIQHAPLRRLTIRDLIPVGRTTSNLVEYVKENVFTNNAGPQVTASSPHTNSENAGKPESNITFTLASAPVVTLAHFIRASKQILADAPALEDYIRARLIYGLKLEEEDEILNGTGATGELNGLRNQETAYTRNVAGDTRLDTLRRAITQLSLSEYSAEGIVVNPIDWEYIDTQKDTTGRYIVGNPQGTLAPRLWGLPVVVTNAMPVDNFLVANYSLACQLWDREQASVSISLEDADNFTKNMVTILAEERLALAVYRPTALIGGAFPQTGTGVSS